MASLVIKNGTVVTLGNENRVLENHDVVIEGSRIARICPSEELEAREGASGARKMPERPEIIDARGKVVLPGFINAHMHFYSTFARGLGKAMPAADFREVLENLWWRLDRELTLEDCTLSAQVALLDCIRKGTTTIIDHHASPCAIRGSLVALAETVKESGLRACLCYELSDRDGTRATEEGLAENIDFINYTRRENDDQLRALFGLHASFTLSNRTMNRAVQAAQNAQVGFHVHVAEAESDQMDCLRNHGMRVVDRLEKAGVLGPDTICAHCVHVDDQEIRILAKTGAQIVHNPQSNMNNAVGIADTLKFSHKGITVGLGTDAMTVNMLEELRSALWIQKLHQRSPSAAFLETVNTLIMGNARIAKRYWDLGLGELREGHAADIVLIDYLAPTPLNTETFLGHLVFGLAESQVDTTIVGGRVLMQGRRLKLDWDEERILAKSREHAAKLWDRF